MPILEVEIVVTAHEKLDAFLAQSLADAAGETFGAQPGTTWVRLRRLPQQDYAESGGIRGNIHPVFVTVLKARRSPSRELKAEIEKLTKVIARLCDRPPENIHLLYAPEWRGRVAFGGRLVE